MSNYRAKLGLGVAFGLLLSVGVIHNADASMTGRVFTIGIQPLIEATKEANAIKRCELALIWSYYDGRYPTPTYFPVECNNIIQEAQ